MVSPGGGVAGNAQSGPFGGALNGSLWSGPEGLGWGPPDALRGLIEGFEGQIAEGMERFVAGEGFSELLVGITENTVAILKMSTDLWDGLWRTLRLAGRSDIDRLAGQLARTEDKLELLLQAIEQLQDRREGV